MTNKNELGQVILQMYNKEHKYHKIINTKRIRIDFTVSKNYKSKQIVGFL